MKQTEGPTLVPRNDLSTTKHAAAEQPMSFMKNYPTQTSPPPPHRSCHPRPRPRPYWRMDPPATSPTGQPAYHSKQNGVDAQVCCGCAILPLNTTVRGPAPPAQPGESRGNTMGVLVAAKFLHGCVSHQSRGLLVRVCVYVCVRAPPCFCFFVLGFWQPVRVRGCWRTWSAS